MNIAIFTDTYYPQINGVVTSTMTLAQELRKLGHNVYIFTPNDNGIDKTDISEKYIYRFPSMPFVFSRNHRMTLVYPPKLLLTFRKLNLDIVHTQTEFSIGFLGRLVADFYDLPSVHTYHTMYEDYVHYILNGHLITKKGAKRFSRIFCNRADHVIAPVPKTKKALLEYGVKKPISVIPTGLNLSVFSKEIDKEETNALKRSLNIPLDKQVVLSVGRVAKEKSPDVIVNAFKTVVQKNKNVVLLIVGGGPFLDDLKALVIKNNISDYVFFTDFVLNKDIHKYYKLGDVFVTASTSETQGLTYIEAMASGLPLIVKKDDSIKDVVTHNKNGLVFSKDNRLPELILELLANESKRELFIYNSSEIVKKYSCDTFCKNVNDIYIKTVSTHKHHKVAKFVKKTKGKLKWKN